MTANRSILGASTFLKAVVLAAVAIHGAAGAAHAGCTDFPSPVGFFAPPPVPLHLDLRSRPANITSVFWQIGFGNQTVNTGLGATGTGMSGAGAVVFNGNDNGLALSDVQELYDDGFPRGYLRAIDPWGAFNDGCLNNARDLSLPYADDGRLNPYYDVFQARYYQYPGIYSLAWQQDYPVAMLLKESTGAWFALAAAATRSRGNSGDGQNGPCSPVNPGSNPAPCDTLTLDQYDFQAIADGLPNPLDPGKNNIIPWQATPQPRVTSAAPTDPNDLDSDWSVNVQWTPVTLHSDRSVRPSTNPSLAPADPSAAPGVGVLDIASKFPLIRYVLETANVSDPGFTSPTGQMETTSTYLSGLTIPADDCLRVRTLFGKKPQTTAVSVANCRIGRCGDIGYEVVSGTICPGSCTSSPEICDGRDNDCDGVIDNGNPGSGLACTTGDPGVCSPGATSCSGGQTICMPDGPPSAEICDGLDNDCDGSVDEGNPGGGANCNSGQPGECAQGTLRCLGGQITCAGFPSPESCDGRDNDCDGLIDDGPVIVAAISPGTINVRSQGATFTVDLAHSSVCSSNASIAIDPASLSVVHISLAGNSVLPDPSTIACPGAGGDTAFERGVFDDVGARSVRNDATRLRFDRPPDGNCQTLDGDRQDLVALLSDWLDGTGAPLCVSGQVMSRSFQACTLVTVQNRGNR